MKTYYDFTDDASYWQWINQTAAELVDNVNDPSLEPGANADALVYDSGWFNDYDAEVKTDLFVAVHNKLNGVA